MPRSSEPGLHVAHRPRARSFVFPLLGSSVYILLASGLGFGQLGPAWPFTCVVILADMSHQLSKDLSPCSVPTLSFNDDPMGSQAGTGMEKYKLPFERTKPILSEHLLRAGAFRSAIHCLGSVTDTHLIQEGPLDIWRHVARRCCL